MTIEAKRQLEILTERKRELSIAILPDEEASLRFAVFLGFETGEDICRGRRRWVLREITRNPDVRKPIGNGYVIPMTYQAGATEWLS
jgi:hypothetical protein